MSDSRLTIPVVGCLGAGSTNLLRCLSQPEWKFDEKKSADTISSTYINWGESSFFNVPMDALHLSAIEEMIQLSPMSVMVIDLSKVLNDQITLLRKLPILMNNRGIYIVGTKLDETKLTAEDLKKIPEELKKLIGQQFEFTYLGSCSAKTGAGIEECKAALSNVIEQNSAAVRQAYESLEARARALNIAREELTARLTATERQMDQALAERRSCHRRLWIGTAFFGGIIPLSFAAATITAQQTTAQIITLLALNFAAGFGLVLAVELIAFMLLLACFHCCLPTLDTRELYDTIMMR